MLKTLLVATFVATMAVVIVAPSASAEPCDVLAEPFCSIVKDPTGGNCYIWTAPDGSIVIDCD